MTRVTKFFKIYVLPPEHGGWFLLLGPFLLGTLAAGKLNLDLIVLLLLSLMVYISRQPLVILVKALSGRRTRSDARPALLALVVPGAVDALLLGALLWRGYWYLLWLGIPAGLVLIWQLVLVTQREERQMGIELVGAGTLALVAPAAYWISFGEMAGTGWWLWALAWLYAAASIVYVYLRLKQRKFKAGSRANEFAERGQDRAKEIQPAMPPPQTALRQTTAPGGNKELVRASRRTLLYAGGALAVSTALALLGQVPAVTPVVYLLALAHFAYGVTHPCFGVRPARVGIEQSLATLAFYLMLGVVFAV